MSLAKKILIALALVLILIQFVRPERNVSAARQPNDIFVKFPASNSVQMLVKKACYDCHSNNTTYPWYINVQPVGLWLEHHIKEGKAELNFSEFASYPAKKGDHKLKEVIEQVNEKEMPLSSYTLIHQDARLTDEERNLIVEWARESRK
jgi:uncharacterized membrane protein